MKLKAVEFDGSSHRRVETKEGKEIGLLYLDVDGFYYYEPTGSGGFEAHTLRDIAALLDEINKPHKDRIDAYFKIKAGDKVVVVREGKNYSTYEDMFKKLGFREPYEVKLFNGVKKDIVYTVFNTGLHLDGKTNLFAIRDEEGNEFLFGENGIERYEELPEINF